MILMIGPTAVSVATRIRRPLAIAIAGLWASRTSTSTATGVQLLITGMRGFRASIPDGLRITPATGPGLIPGAGRGWTTILGDTLRSITDAGLMSVTAGAGSRVPG